MTTPSLRRHKIVGTYLWHPDKDVSRHVLVSTSSYEGFNPDNDYNEGTETMAFETWRVSTNPREILQRIDPSKGMYQLHNDVVNGFLEQGYTKLKTRRQDYSDGPGRGYHFNVGDRIEVSEEGEMVILDRFMIRGRRGYAVECPVFFGDERVWIPERALRVFFNPFTTKEKRLQTLSGILHPKQNLGNGRYAARLEPVY